MTQQVPLSMLEPAAIKSMLPPGMEVAFAGSSAPTGWLLEDGSAVSRTTYADLFAAIGTAHGAGDGSTTFNVPDRRGRSIIGAGTGTDVEAIASQTAAGNAVTVGSNAAKWITGRQVVVSALTGFASLTNGTYYLIRNSATSISFATTLANAQNGVAATLTGTGTMTVTATLTARTLGEKGGEETHAMSATELLAHTHTNNGAGNTAAGNFMAQTPNSSQFNATTSTGGNAAMNNMQPYGVSNWIIKT